MRKNQLHIFAIVICSLLTIPLLSIVVLQLRQKYLSATAEERIEFSLIETISVPESKLVWREEGREVTIDGEYFDLVSWKLENGIYTLSGVYDKEETAISNLLEKQAGAQSSLIRLLILGQCFAAIIIYLINFFYIHRLNKASAFFENHYKYRHLDIILAPPRLW